MWGFSICALLRGDSQLIAAANGLGFSTTYKTMKEFRQQVFFIHKNKKIHETFDRILLLQPAWDNIDAKMTTNNHLKLTENKELQSIVLTATQIFGTAPIVIPELHTPISLITFPKLSDMLLSPRVRDFNLIRNAEAIMCAAVWYWRQNLTNTNDIKTDAYP